MLAHTQSYTRPHAHSMCNFTAEIDNDDNDDGVDDDATAVADGDKFFYRLIWITAFAVVFVAATASFFFKFKSIRSNFSIESIAWISSFDFKMVAVIPFTHAIFGGLKINCKNQFLCS